ncbi:hypothetical protein F4677DRAFT_399597, partial [Hypoxylon crocopeplum]
MRQDTLAGIELTRGGIELTKAAKIDSSSMKVIAVMTMVFLPGTFFATLFSIPSLNWNQANVVGENFWMYWAFTIPFTMLVIVLWLVITQRRQMKSVFHTGKKRWFNKKSISDEEANGSRVVSGGRGVGRGRRSKHSTMNHF